MLAKGTYYGFSSQTINDSVPAGVCSSGQSAIPYYTTWSIPSNLAAGSDYKVVVTGQLADSVVGQFGDGIGDDSDAPFTITAGDKVSVVATDSDNSPDYLTNYIAYPITPERYPDLFRKGVGPVFMPVVRRPITLFTG
jgi:hypothetical protein